MLDSEKLLGNLASILPYCEVLKRCSSKSITHEEFIALTLQRHQNSAVFVPLLEAGIVAAKTAGDIRLQTALERNWRDETGRDSNGTVHSARAHSTWRMQYLSGIGVSDESIEMWWGTWYYNDTIKYIANTGDPYIIAGAILFLECFIPDEFAALRAARDHFYPSLHFTACRYLDDHIVHDTNYHYPDLLRALTITGVHNDIDARISRGMMLVWTARGHFYKNARENFHWQKETE